MITGSTPGMTQKTQFFDPGKSGTTRLISTELLWKYG